MPISYVLINSNLGTDVQIIKEIKEMLADQNDVKLEIQGVYGVYDIIIKLSSKNNEKLIVCPQKVLPQKPFRNLPQASATHDKMATFCAASAKASAKLPQASATHEIWHVC